MKFSRLSLELICCEEYRNDPVIKAFYDIFSDDCETAVKGYSAVCRVLFSENITLSDYIFLMTTGCNNPILRNYLASRSSTLLGAVKNDMSVLSAVALTEAAEVISELKSRFGELSALEFAEYEAGNTHIGTEAVISFCERFGTALFAYNKAFVFENGALEPSAGFDSVRLSDLKNYNSQRSRLIDNTLCFLNGAKAQNALLYGDRGTGKSSTVKALVNEYPELRIIQLPKSAICDIYKVYDIVKDNPLKFILFIDDITFSENDAGYSFLKQVLEGSVVSVPENCIIYATTNRRHIIKETESERTGDEMHAADARDENMSLADRFGLYITFLSPNKGEYQDIVSQIAADRKLDIAEDRLLSLAERFALKKCGRSPRTAKQFVDMLEARLELDLGLDNL